MLKVPLKSLGLRGLGRRLVGNAVMISPYIASYPGSIWSRCERPCGKGRTVQEPAVDGQQARQKCNNRPKGGCAIRDRRQIIGCERRSALLRRDGCDARPL